MLAVVSRRGTRLKIATLISQSLFNVSTRDYFAPWKTTTAVCDFLINTPLSKCAIGKSSDENRPVVLRYKHSECERDEDGDSDKAELVTTGANEASIDSLAVLVGTGPDSPNDAKADLNEATEDSTKVKADPSTEESSGSSDKPWSGGSTQSFDTSIHRKNSEDVEQSVMAVFNATNDLNLNHAKNYMEWVIGYLVELEEIISTR